jgi:protein-S-isoprenylcysteine O-methyltransferase Ste14
MNGDVRRSKLKSYLLVFVQFACLGALVLTGPVLARNPILLVVEVAALALALWALLTVRLDNMNVTPDVRPDSVMVSHGPYRYIRHPMYASILLGALALVLDTPSPLRWAIWGVLLVNLIVKLTYEETLLVAHHPEYAALQQIRFLNRPNAASSFPLQQRPTVPSSSIFCLLSSARSMIFRYVFSFTLSPGR